MTELGGCIAHGAKTVLQATIRKKVISSSSSVLETKLRRCLSTFDLALVGIGSTLGSGVYVLTGDIARNLAGPSIVLSFFIAALASTLSGLCYAEFGARVPKAGSAYFYAYITVGEFIAFVVGWNLVLEYVIGSAAVARGLSAYFDSLVGYAIKDFFIKSIGVVHVPGLSATYLDFVAFGVVILVTIMLSFGVKNSARINNICTFTNVLVIIMLITMGLFYADLKNWKPFAPFGLNGVIAGASRCFFAFIGFDIIATTGEEAKTPSKSIPIGIITTTSVCFLAYFGVSGVLTLMVPYNKLQGDAALATAFDQNNLNAAKYIISTGALIGLTGTIVVALVPMPRLLYAMADDGLIFSFCSYVYPRTGVPLVSTIIAGLLSATFALVLQLQDLIEMVSIGTLLAYTIVTTCVLLQRYSPAKPISKSPSIVTGLEDMENPTEDTPLLIRPVNFPSDGPTKRTSFRVGIAVILIFIELFAITATLSFLQDELTSGSLAVILPLLCVCVALIATTIFIYIQPQNPQRFYFNVPLMPFLPITALFFNIYLIFGLKKLTWIRFAVWMVLGLLMYFGYGMWHSTERYPKVEEANTSPEEIAADATSDKDNDMSDEDDSHCLIP